MSEPKRSPSKVSQPITHHPLFPAIVALWAGAVLALVSVAVPPSLIEYVVQMLRIDRVLPMAAPPLGTTARVLIVLTMAGIGGLLGWEAARRLARPVARPAGTAASPAPARRRDTVPVQPLEAGADILAVRRRGLSLEPRVKTDDTTSPHPGILNLAAFDLDGFEAGAEPGDGRRAGKPSPDGYHAEGSNDAAPALTNSLFDAYSRDLPHESLPGPTAEAEVADQGKTEEPAAPLTGRTAAERIASAALDDLSPLELLERLALAMASRRERVRVATLASTGASTVSVPPAEAAPGEPLHAVVPNASPADSPAPSFTGSTIPRQLPAALRPIDVDAIAGTDGNDALPGYIPPRHIGLAPADADEAEREDTGTLRHGYSSLLDLSRPAAGHAEGSKDPASAARHFDAPEKGDSGSDPEQAERALRAALDTLQRMSGAA